MSLWLNWCQWILMKAKNALPLMVNVIISYTFKQCHKEKGKTFVHDLWQWHFNVTGNYKKNLEYFFNSLISGFMEGPLTFRGYDMDYYRSLLNKTEEEEKTDVPFKILNQELLPYNIIKKYSQAKREERKEKLREERENTKIWKDKSDCIVNKGFFF